jgi:hypothetical protein
LRNELFSLRIFFLYSLSVLTAELLLLLPLLLLLEVILLERDEVVTGAINVVEGANENAADVVEVVVAGLADPNEKLLLTVSLPVSIVEEPKPMDTLDG